MSSIFKNPFSATSQESSQFQASTLNISGGNFVNTLHGGQAWEKLVTAAAAEAVHDSSTLAAQGICLENTRKAVLERLKDYISSTDPASPNILWLNGPAGSGKSAIARTIAKSTQAAHTLLGNFFFYHADSTRNNATPFIPTLAVELCDRFRQAQPLVENAIEAKPWIFTKSMYDQASTLIAGPLKQVFADLQSIPPTSTPLVILVDGLDECKGEDWQVEIIGTLVKLVEELNTSPRFRVKVVLFSRPERHLRKQIRRHEEAGRMASVVLDGDLNPRADIELYYKTHFDETRCEHPMGSTLGDTWPTADEMKALLDVTGTHFALAHTIRTFASNHDEDPKKQLAIVLSISRGSSNSPQEFLDKLYTEILLRIPNSIRLQTLRIIGAILVPTDHPLPPSPFLLKLVFGLQDGEIQDIFSYLESLFDLGDRVSSPIRPYHKSLADFLFDPLRSQQHGLFLKKDDVSQYIQDSIRSVFSRGDAPDKPTLVALCTYLRQQDTSLKQVVVFYILDILLGFLPLLLLWLSSAFGRAFMTTPPRWTPWGFAFFHFEPSIRTLAILKGLAPLSSVECAWTMVKKDESTYRSAALPIYARSASGRLCLVLSRPAFMQTFNKRVCTFPQAFIRHAIRSDPILLEHDQTVGWNLITSKLNNLAKAWICYRSRGDSYRLEIEKQVEKDLSAPGWITSRLGMLRLWHEGGHVVTDDPWEHAGRTGLEVASESQLSSCPQCIEVLQICKSQVHLCLQHSPLNAASATADAGRTYNAMLATLRSQLDATYTIIATSLRTGSMYTHREFGTRLTVVPAETDKALRNLKEFDGIDQAILTTPGNLKFHTWKIRVYAEASVHPFSRACIPTGFDPKDVHEHALRVAMDRVDWDYKYTVPLTIRKKYLDLP